MISRILIVFAVGLLAGCGTPAPAPTSAQAAIVPIVLDPPQSPPTSTTESTPATVLKPHATTPTPATLPTPSTSPTTAKTGKLTTVDLTPHGVRAVIDLPEGCQVKKEYGTVKITGGGNFAINIRNDRDSLKDEKERLRKLDTVKFLADEPTALFAVNGNEAVFASFTARKEVAIGEKPFTAEGDVFGGRVREQAERNWASVRTFHQTEAQQLAEKPRLEALAKLKELQVQISDDSDGLEIRLVEATATDANISLLKAIPDLTRVTIGKPTAITPAGMKALAGLRTIRKLLVYGDTMTDTLFAGLNPMPGLESLEMTDTMVSDVGLAALAGMTDLSEFIVQYGQRIRFTDAGIKHLAGLVKMTKLELEGHPITDAGMAALARLTELTRLNLRDTPVTDEGLKHLSGKAKLTSLSLTGTRVRGPGLAHLAGSPELQSIWLNDTDVTNDGLAAIRGLRGKGLTIDVSGTAVGDIGVGYLAAIPGLVALHLDQTRTTDAGIKLLAGCPELNRLSLKYTDVAGTTLGELRACSKLRDLLLDGTGLTDAQLPALLAFSNLSYLMVSDTALTDAALKSLEKLPADRSLSIGCDRWLFSRSAIDASLKVRPKITFFPLPPAELPAMEVKAPAVPPAPAKLDSDAMFKRLEIKPTIDEDAPGKPVVAVSMFSDKLTDADIAQLRGLNALKELTVYNNAITDLGAAHLAQLTSLESLAINSDGVTDAGVAALAGLTRLKSLELRSSKITGDGFVFLKGMKDLRKLNLPFRDFGPRHLAPLADLKKIEELSLGSENTETSPHAAQLYAALPNLKSLSLKKPTNRFLASLQSVTSPESVMIDTGFGEKVATVRGLTGLTGMTKLKQLTIDAKVDDRGVAVLGGFPELTMLQLRSAEGVTDDGLAAMAKLTKLQDLALTNSRVTGPGLAKLAVLPNLMYLNLARSRVTDAGIAELAKLPALTRLSLFGTAITDACIPVLAKLPHLKRVELNDTRISRQGVEKLRALNGDLEVDFPEPTK